MKDSSTAEVHEIVFGYYHEPRLYMARSREWKYVRYKDGGEELYHLTEDASELRNLALAPEGAADRRHLSEALTAHLREIGELGVS